MNALFECAGRAITVFDPDSRQYLLSQDLDADCDGQADTLLFQLALAPGQSRTLQRGLSEVYPLPAIGGASYERIVPERDDDFAWKDNRIAFRVYGPALEQKGEISSGIDVWGKRVGRNVVNDWYENGQSLLHNHHQDHGEGADFYKVGEALGVGGNGLWKDGRLHMPANLSRAGQGRGQRRGQPGRGMSRRGGSTSGTGIGYPASAGAQAIPRRFVERPAD